MVPEDETALQSAFANVPKLVLARFTQIDYDRQMALVLTNPGIPGTQDIYAVARLLEDPDRISADLLIAVAQPWAGRGMGRALLGAIIAYSRTRGIGQINVEVPPEAHALRGLCSAHGFVERDREDVLSLSL